MIQTPPVKKLLSVPEASPFPFEEEGSESTPQFFVSWRNQKGEMERGPLQVLWDLIESYQIDIFDLSLERLTGDFLQFIEDNKALELDPTASFMYMAARLVYSKSRALLPNLEFEEREEEHRLPPELVQQLLEYRKYQIASEKLRAIEELSSGMYTRNLDAHPQGERKIDQESDGYLDLNLTDMIVLYSRFLKALDLQDQKKEDLSYELENYKVADQMAYLENLLEKLDSFRFEEIFENPKCITKGELITSFLALLELTKQAKIIIRQKNNFSEIRIFKQTILVG